METAKGFLSLTSYSDCIVRVRYAFTQHFSANESLMVQQPAQGSVAFDVNETTESLIVSIPKLSIRINKQTGALTYLDNSGQILTKEPDRGGKTFVPVNVVKSVFDNTAEAQIRKDADGVHSHVTSVKQVVDRQAFHTKLEFEWM